MMAHYQCPLQADINSLKATANKLKDKAIKQLFNKGWSIFYSGPTQVVTINLEALSDDYHNIASVLEQLNHSQHIIDFCKQNIEEEDYVVF